VPEFFDLQHIFFTVLGYEMSHLEFWATLTGGIAVVLSARENVWSWIVGLVNVSLAFLMFYQAQLYPDMFLQVFFFTTNLIGFYLWKYPAPAKANANQELKITRMDKGHYLLFVGGVTLATLAMGKFSANLHELFPSLFYLPSSFPYLDSFVLTASIATTFLMMRKKVETWWMWLVIDIISTYIYYQKDIKVYSMLYLVFCFIATYGAIAWTRKFKNYELKK
jgi:nicotinamide mononucleotide transporter